MNFFKIIQIVRKDIHSNITYKIYNEIIYEKQIQISFTIFLLTNLNLSLATKIKEKTY